MCGSVGRGVAKHGLRFKTKAGNWVDAQYLGQGDTLVFFYKGHDGVAFNQNEMRKFFEQIPESKDKPAEPKRQCIMCHGAYHADEAGSCTRYVCSPQCENRLMNAVHPAPAGSVTVRRGDLEVVLRYAEMKFHANRELVCLGDCIKQLRAALGEKACEHTEWFWQGDTKHCKNCPMVRVIGPWQKPEATK